MNTYSKEDLEISEAESEEFYEKADELQSKIEVVCDQEQHAGVTVWALLNTLGVQLHELSQTNGFNKDEVIKAAQEDLGEIYVALCEGKYYYESVGDPKLN